MHFQTLWYTVSLHTPQIGHIGSIRSPLSDNLALVHKALHTAAATKPRAAAGTLARKRLTGPDASLSRASPSVTAAAAGRHRAASLRSKDLTTAALASSSTRLGDTSVRVNVAPKSVRTENGPRNAHPMRAASSLAMASGPRAARQDKDRPSVASHNRRHSGREIERKLRMLEADQMSLAHRTIAATWSLSVVPPLTSSTASKDLPRALGRKSPQAKELCLGQARDFCTVAGLRPNT